MNVSWERPADVIKPLKTSTPKPKTKKGKAALLAEYQLMELGDWKSYSMVLRYSHLAADHLAQAAKLAAQMSHTSKSSLDLSQGLKSCQIKS
jgi:hypothetical protein